MTPMDARSVPCNLQAAASAADLQIILFIENRCFQTDLSYFAIILWIWKAARKGNILSQRDGSDGACRRFRFRNGFAKADQIKTKSRQNLAKDQIKTK